MIYIFLLGPFPSSKIKIIQQNFSATVIPFIGMGLYIFFPSLFEVQDISYHE